MRVLSIASGSLSELDTHLEIAHQLGYIKNREEIEDKAGHVFRLLTGLAASLKRKNRD